MEEISHIKLFGIGPSIYYFLGYLDESPFLKLFLPLQLHLGSNNPNKRLKFWSRIVRTVIQTMLQCYLSLGYGIIELEIVFRYLLYSRWCLFLIIFLFWIFLWLLLNDLWWFLYGLRQRWWRFLLPIEFQSYNRLFDRLTLTLYQCIAQRIPQSFFELLLFKLDSLSSIDSLKIYFHFRYSKQHNASFITIDK